MYLGAMGKCGAKNVNTKQTTKYANYVGIEPNQLFLQRFDCGILPRLLGV